MQKFLITLIGTLIAGLSLTGCALNADKTYDLVIIGGRVIDPETHLDAIRNVGIVNGRIEAVTSKSLQGKQQINATNLVVSPGFIDLHAHGQNVIGQTYQVRDGVTTAVDLEWGYTLPKSRDERDGKSLINYGTSACYYDARFLAKNNHNDYYEGKTIAKDDLQKTHHEVASESELAKMRLFVEQELDAGALGIGLPLDYISKGVNNVELEAIFRLAASRDVPLFIHIRVSDKPTDPSGFQELIRLTRKTGASLHMVHIVSTALERTSLYINMMDQARAEGLDITTELYPYTAASTGINAGIFDHDWQSKFSISYSDIEWPPTGERFTGKVMWDDYRDQYPDGMVIMYKMKEEWVEKAIAHPDIIVASDGMPMESLDQRAHPRGMGTYARVLGRYVREKKILTLSEAIRKISYLPAKRLEAFTPMMKRKGRIQVGADADITIFNPDTVIDRATFAQPNQYSKGITHVIVAGQLVVKEEALQHGIFPGKLISTINN